MLLLVISRFGFPLVIVILLHHHLFFFFFNDTATTEIYTLSLHDALPIYAHRGDHGRRPRTSLGVTLVAYARRSRGRAAARERAVRGRRRLYTSRRAAGSRGRSEEHTSELQSHLNLVCRLLLEKKKHTMIIPSAKSVHMQTSMRIKKLILTGTTRGT